jgi:hypothetical protein
MAITPSTRFLIVLCIAFIFCKGLNAQSPGDSTVNTIFQKVEVHPVFPGGSTEWRKFILRHLSIDSVVDKGAPAGEYHCEIKFFVNKDGSLSEFEPLTNNGYGMEQECIRVLKLSPAWEPARQNGRIVKAQQKQKFTFTILDEDIPKKKKEKKEKTEALKDPLYVIDGKTDTSVHSWNVDALYRKEMVESVNILKGTAATLKYGSAAAGGAVEITLRRPKESPVPGIPKISVAALRSVDLPTFLKLEPGMEIISFTFTIDRADGTIASVHNAGNSFHPKIKELMVNAVPGRLITIDLIRVRVDGKEKKLPSRIYEVVE